MTETASSVFCERDTDISGASRLSAPHVRTSCRAPGSLHEPRDRRAGFKSIQSFARRSMRAHWAITWTFDVQIPMPILCSRRTK